MDFYRNVNTRQGTRRIPYMEAGSWRRANLCVLVKCSGKRATEIADSVISFFPPFCHYYLMTASLMDPAIF